MAKAKADGTNIIKEVITSPGTINPHNSANLAVTVNLATISPSNSKVVLVGSSREAPVQVQAQATVIRTDVLRSRERDR